MLGLIDGDAPATGEAGREKTHRPDRGARSRSAHADRSANERPTVEPPTVEPDRGVLAAVTAAARADTGLGGMLLWLLGATTVLMLLAARRRSG